MNLWQEILGVQEENPIGVYEVKIKIKPNRNKGTVVIKPGMQRVEK